MDQIQSTVPYYTAPSAVVSSSWACGEPYRLWPYELDWVHRIIAYKAQEGTVWGSKSLIPAGQGQHRGPLAESQLGWGGVLQAPCCLHPAPTYQDQELHTEPTRLGSDSNQERGCGALGPDPNTWKLHRAQTSLQTGLAPGIWGQPADWLIINGAIKCKPHWYRLSNSGCGHIKQLNHAQMSVTGEWFTILWQQYQS